MENQPTRFGRYVVKGVIGKGAMGVIYLAEDPVIGRQVAIKVIQLQPGLSDHEIESLKTRFEREFRSAGTLSHPNIVTVHDVGTEGHTPFIAMEYVQGKTLEHLINEQRALTFEDIMGLVSPICDALDFAHANGVVHRDIKPANILLDRSQRPKITDFGVAKLTESGMTHTGAVVGTPWYMSPEQVVGEPVTGAADQFSVAVMAYQLLTRERPFSGERSSTVLYKIVHEEPTRPHLLNPRLEEELDDALLRAFHKNPDQRYPTCSAFARELEAALGVAAPRDPGSSGVVPPTEWPTAAMKLDAAALETLRAAAQSGTGSRAGSGARSGAGSGARSGAASAARSAARSGATSAARSAVPGASKAPPAAPQEPSSQEMTLLAAPPKPSRPTPWLAIGGGIAGVVVIGLLLALFLGNRAGDARPDPAAEIAATIPDLETAPLDLPADLAAIEPPPESATEDLASAGTTDAAGAAGEAESQTFRIVTRPAGATVSLNGEALELITPAEVQLRTDERQTIDVQMEGFKPVRWTFASERLTPEQVRTRTLYFPLTAVETAAAATDDAPAPAPPSRPAPEIAQAPVLTSPPGQVDPKQPTVRGGKEVDMPKRIRDAAPLYSPDAVPANRQPIVILELTLDPEGEVAAAKVLRGLTPELDRAAIEAAWQWRYEPSVHKGKPANTIVSTTVLFQAP